MNSPEQRLLILCARAQIDAEQAARVTALVAEGLDWEKLLRAARAHRLLPLVYWHLNAGCPDSVPKTTLGELREFFHANARRNLRLTGELLRIIELLESNGIAVLPYKGPTLAMSAYGNLALRSFTDLDLMVSRHDVPKARELLGSRGYLPQFQLTNAGEKAFLSYACELMFFREKDDYSVDLHWEFTPRYFSFPLDVKSLFERLDTAPLNQSMVRAMPSEDLLLILCVHEARELWPRLGGLCSIAEIVRSNPRLDWKRALREAAKLGAERMLLTSLILAHDLLEMKPPEEVLQKIKADKAVRLLAEQIKERLFRAPQDQPGPFKMAFFHLRIRENLGDKIRYCFQLAFTPTITDWGFGSLPAPLSFFYLPLRVLRLSSKHGWRLFLKHCVEPIGRAFESPWRYLKTILSTLPGRAALVLALMASLNLTEGIGLLMLIPMLQCLGLDARQGGIGRLGKWMASFFAFLGARPSLASVLILYTAIVSAYALLNRCQATASFALQDEFVLRLRQRLYRSIAQARWSFHSKSRSSEFAHALTMELDRLGATTYYAFSLATQAFAAAVYLAVAFQLSPAMTALTGVCGATLWLLLRGKTRSAAVVGDEISSATQGLYAAMLGHLDGVKTAKSHGAEEQDAELFSGLTESVSQAQKKAVLIQAEAKLVFDVGVVSALSLILYVALGVLSLKTSAALLLLFLFARLMPKLSSIQQSSHQFLQLLPAFSRVMGMIERCEGAREFKAQDSRPMEFKREIRLEGVSFNYPGKQTPALENLDLTLPAGKTTILVGPSGAGKSTIADLVMGLLSPDQGRVLVDDAPLEPSRLKAWRERIGYVAQDTFLFHDTVRANLLWARPGAADREIRAALRLAAAEEFVAQLPQGLETVIGDRGQRLSGGERQRLALARALLREPSLLILDEATNSLDAENERRIHDAIEGLHGRVTLLIITHRTASIRKADVVYSLARGGAVPVSLCPIPA